MANHKSAEKRHRQSLKRRLRNRTAKAAVRTAVKKTRAAVESKDPNAAELLRAAERAIAKAASKGLFHRKNAARQISRLASAVANQAKTNG
jgi:small subunit ribosomal protein S20